MIRLKLEVKALRILLETYKYINYKGIKILLLLILVITGFFYEKKYAIF